MKTHYLILGLALLGAVAAPNTLADAVADTAHQQVVQAIASKDAGQVMNVLPVIEKMWPAQPADYFESMKNAAGTLDAALTDAHGRTAISNLFSRLIQKEVPAAPESAIPILEGKRDTILYFLNFKEVREDKTNLLALARYIGALRDQIIPNFVPKPVSLNPPGLFEATPAQAQQIIQTNDQNKAFNNWQYSLVVENNILTMQLIVDAGAVAAGDPASARYLKDIATAAHLTDDEQHQLQ